MLLYTVTCVVFYYVLNEIGRLLGKAQCLVTFFAHIQVLVAYVMLSVFIVHECINIFPFFSLGIYFVILRTLKY